MNLLDDATALHLEAAQGGLRHIVRDIAQSGGCRRQTTEWLEGVSSAARCLEAPDLGRLSDIAGCESSDACGLVFRQQTSSPLFRMHG